MTSDTKKPISEEQENQIMAKFALKILEKIDDGEEELYPMSTLVNMTNDDYPYDLGRFSNRLKVFANVAK